MNTGVIVFKRKLNKKSSLNLGGILCLVIAVYVMCYLLILDAVTPISINSMLSYFSHLTKHWHVLAIALLPVYIALMVFGTAVIGVYFGSVLHRWVVRMFKTS